MKNNNTNNNTNRPNALNRVLLSVALLIGLGLNSCSDTDLAEYKPETVVEAYLIVNESIENVRVMKTQPLTSRFNFDNYNMKNATVQIIGDGQTFDLQYDNENHTGYFYADKEYKVKPNTEYSLNIKMADGTIITGKTMTPEQTKWNKKLPSKMQFPIDSTKQVGKDILSWDKANMASNYYLTVTCMDTLGYGKYLDPPTDELNRRTCTIANKFGKNSKKDFNEYVTTVFLRSNSAPVIWSLFRWYGKHSLSVYALDANMKKWMLQNHNQKDLDERLTTINNAIGCFGSASVIRDTVFIIKNQP